MPDRAACVPFISLVLLALLAVPLAGQDGAALSAALERAGDNRAELERAMAAAPASQRAGLEFLVANMPAHDLRELKAAFLLENLALAYEARTAAPWGDSIPDELFLDAVLPYASATEPRHAWRQEFRERFLPLVKDCRRPGEAAQRLNEKIFGILGVKYSTKRKRADQSPRESIEQGLASCTGLSIILVDACRAVGVPARLAGIPSWVNKRGNHTWVEVWDAGWHFTGAAEPDAKGLDHTWFQADAALAQKGSPRHGIYAVSYRRTGLSFPIAWRRGIDWVQAVEVTERYTDDREQAEGSTRLMIDVFDGADGPRIEAQVTLTDKADPQRVYSGLSKGPSADTNDHLELRVPWDRVYAVRATRGAQTMQLEHRVARDPQAMLGLHLPRDAEVEALRGYFEATPEARADWKFDRGFERLVSADEKRARARAWQAFRTADIHTAARRDFDAHRVRSGKHQSPYTVRPVGRKPAGGWPLFIAMHGGGGAPKAVNDRGWRTMQRYYRDQSSVEGYLYLALRAPNDTWNGFYDDYVYPLIEELVSQFLLFGEVDPDRVFLMGYSHGGYGAFAIGPKIPYRFAAVHSSAAAPTDGETSTRTLRTTIFTFMIGEHDRAYGRLDRCRAFDAAIQKLRGERTDIYPVRMEYKPGFGHGGLPDRDKIAGMYPAVRNPVPRELSWELTDSVVDEFFWLHIPQPSKGQSVEARLDDNHLKLDTVGVGALGVYLDRRLTNFKKPLTIELNGATSEHRLRPSARILCDSLLERRDPELAFSARIDLPVRDTDR